MHDKAITARHRGDRCKRRWADTRAYTPRHKADEMAGTTRRDERGHATV